MAPLLTPATTAAPAKLASRPRIATLALMVAALLPACRGVPEIPGITPYRIPIQQGNFLSQEMVSQLKVGMTREQVRFVLGTPLVTDIFHADRWDYVFHREVKGAKPEQRRLTVFFAEDRLARVTGDVVPAAAVVAPPAAAAVTPPAATDATPAAGEANAPPGGAGARN